MQNKLVKKPFRINILICQAHVYLITLIMATLYSGVSVSGPCCSQTGLLAPVNVMNQSIINIMSYTSDSPQSRNTAKIILYHIIINK